MSKSMQKYRLRSRLRSMQDPGSDLFRVYFEMTKYSPKSQNGLKWIGNGPFGLKLGGNECQSINELFRYVPYPFNPIFDPIMSIWGPIGSQVGAPIFQVNFVEGCSVELDASSHLQLC